MTRQVEAQRFCCLEANQFRERPSSMGVLVAVAAARFDMWWTRTKALALSLACLLLLVLSAGCGSYRVMSAWELPQGYRGWVLVERSNPKCPRARLTSTMVVFSVNSSGHGCTSTPLAKGLQRLTFWEIDSQGRRQERSERIRRVWSQ